MVLWYWFIQCLLHRRLFLVDCCWLKTPSILLDQVDNGGSFGGVFVSSGIILAPFVVFFSHGRSIYVVWHNFLLRGRMMYGRGGGLDREGRE